MAILTIIKDFITQYIPDFSSNVVEYLLLFCFVVVIVGVFRR